MKRNKGFTLVELIIVLACLTGVLGFFWKILDSSSRDAYTINDKIEIQNSVTSLMNIIQQDIQEAKIILVSESDYGIFVPREDSDKIYENKIYEFGTTDDKKIYTFNSFDRAVTRTSIKEENSVTNTESTIYNNIIGFSLEAVNKTNYGAKVTVLGSKKTYTGNTPISNYKEIGEANVGDYIAYDCGKNYDEGWVVLRNNEGNIEIISKESVGNLRLGGKDGYANAVGELNTEARKYVNNAYAVNGRSVGATEDSIEQINTSIYPIEYDNVQMIGANPPYHDTYYLDDYEAIQSDENFNSSGRVWLATRCLGGIGSNYADFLIRYLDSDGTIHLELFFKEKEDGSENGYYTYGVRPVITLKPDLKIIGGSGRANDPLRIASEDPGNYTEGKTQVDKSRYSLNSTFYTRNTTR